MKTWLHIVPPHLVLPPSLPPSFLPSLLSPLWHVSEYQSVSCLPTNVHYYNLSVAVVTERPVQSSLSTEYNMTPLTYNLSILHIHGFETQNRPVRRCHGPGYE